MATQYPSDRPTQGSSRYSQSSGQARPAGSRPASSARPAGTARPTGTARPAGSARPASARPATGSAQRRPAQQNPNARRPQQRRKKKPQGRFYLILALLLVVIIAVVLIVAKPFGKKPDPVQSNPTAAPVTTDAPTDSTSSLSHAEQLAALLGDENADVQGLSADQMAVVTDLSINQNLPEEWMNILLLGSDERTLTESARTDSMIICSINKNTGEVKLTSIMRDLAVEFDDIGQYSGTHRINSANYFGGEKLAMKTVNECFGMNIDKYVRVNFYGFQQIAHLLGGVEMDITKEEMDQINELIVQQFNLARWNGVDESNLPNQLLETYGENTHLDGRQTLAYARIRKLDGGDYERANRQRKVLGALMEKLSGAGPAELLQLGMSCMQYFRTNLTIEEIMTVATTVLNNGVTTMDSFRLPVNDSYVQERRKEQEMFYDCDWSKNSLELYNFIYG